MREKEKREVVCRKGREEKEVEAKEGRPAKRAATASVKRWDGRYAERFSATFIRSPCYTLFPRPLISTYVFSYT